MKRFYSYEEILEYVRNSDADSIYNYIEYLEGIRRDKTYGLVWEKEKEDFEIQLHDNVPVLVEVSDKDITCDLSKATNLLIATVVCGFWKQRAARMLILTARHLKSI